MLKTRHYVNRQLAQSCANGKRAPTSLTCQMAASRLTVTTKIQGSSTVSRNTTFTIKTVVHVLALIGTKRRRNRSKSTFHQLLTRIKVLRSPDRHLWVFCSPHQLTSYSQQQAKPKLTSNNSSSNLQIKSPMWRQLQSIKLRFNQRESRAKGDRDRRTSITIREAMGW